MARKSGFVRRNNVMRRETLWVSGTFVNNTLASTNAVALTANLNAAGLALRPFTVVRTRGMMHVQSDQLSATEFYGVQMGFAVVSDQALAVGVTAVPTPDTDLESDAWFVHESVFGRIGVPSAASVVELGKSHGYDSRAMRKVEDGFTVIQVIEAVENSAIVMDSFRMLLKLH